MNIERWILENPTEQTFIRVGSIYDDWSDFVSACKKHNKTAVILTPKSPTPKLSKIIDPYPPSLRQALSYEKTIHYEVAKMGMIVVLNSKAMVYQKKYGGITVD